MIACSPRWRLVACAPATRRRVAGLGGARRWSGSALQGAFGALTVTMKLYPAIVTLHLLGGLGLLALLAIQAEARAAHASRCRRAVRRGLWAVAAV